MKYGSDFKEPGETAEVVDIVVGHTHYRLSETDSGRLKINKMNGAGTKGDIAVYPKNANTVEIT